MRGLRAGAKLRSEVIFDPRHTCGDVLDALDVKGSQGFGRQDAYAHRDRGHELFAFGGRNQNLLRYLRRNDALALGVRSRLVDKNAHAARVQELEP
jgi:hypothetical protein